MKKRKWTSQGSKKIAALLVGGVCVLAAGQAFASPFEMYGAGGRAAAMSGAQTASAEGPAALFYNLGALARADEGISGGLIVGINRSQILLMRRPAGYDIPDLGSYSPAVPSSLTSRARQDSTDAGNLYTFTLGAVTSLGLDNFRAGMLLAIPSSGYIDARTHFADERERLFSNQLHYTLIDQRLRRMDMEFGAAYQIADWISAGLGATFSPGTVMGTNAFLPDPGNQANIDLNSAIDTDSNWGLLAGVLVDITDTLQLGVQYRGQVYFRVHGQNRIRVGTSGKEEDRRIVQELDWTPSYSPDTLSAGLAWQLGRSELLLDGRYERWSDFRDTHSQPTGFHDTISPRFGVEYALESGNKLRAGLGWVPSPVPDQTGRTNYVDNDRFMASLGASYYSDALGLPLTIDWALQVQLLAPRTTHKDLSGSLQNCGANIDVVCDEVPDDTSNPRTGQPFDGAAGLQTGNPGFPGYSSGGWMGALVVEISWLP